MGRIIALGAVLALMLTVGALAPSTFAANSGERFTNGTFEEGFAGNGVAIGWTGFSGGGLADYTFADDTGPRFVVDGSHSQFIRISTLPYFVTESDRYAGIYQTVNVVPRAQYTLNMSGMLRLLSDDPDKNNWSYIVQWAMDPTGGTDWGKVRWSDVPWNTTYNESDTGAMSGFTVTFPAPSTKITIFIRALKKFPTRSRVLFVNLDSVSLVGTVPDMKESVPQLDVIVPAFAYTAKSFNVRVNASDDNGISAINLYDDGNLVAGISHVVGMQNRQATLAWTPNSASEHTLKIEAKNGAGKSTSVSRKVSAVTIAEMLKNGSFEDGFAANGVATGWASFNNAGNNVVQYFQDDSWTPVVSSGAHSQMIGISTVGWYLNSDTNRRAGICQVVSGLTINAPYYLTANGTLRISEADESANDWNWNAQWGYQSGADPTCRLYDRVGNWQTLPWPRVDPIGTVPQMNDYTTMFYAPSDTITLYVGAWRKWPIGGPGFLVNVDGLSLAGYKAP